MLASRDPHEAKEISEFADLSLTVGDLYMLQAASQPEGVHGYILKNAFGNEALSHGTIYRRLGRLSAFGYLEASSEEAGNYPGLPRVNYFLTETGQKVFDQAFARLGIQITSQ